MNHSFNTDIAKRVGVDAAVIIENLYYWIEKNKANSKHFYDGNYWTYNSIKAFNDLFPYWSIGQITRILRKLETENFIITGNYNKLAYDRTKWYSLTEIVYCIYRNQQMNSIESTNEIAETNKPIPNINTNIKTNNKKETELDKEINFYTDNEDLKETIKDFLKMRKSIKKPMTGKALTLLLNKLDKMSNNDNSKIEILNQSILHSWQTIYKLKDAAAPEEANNKYKGFEFD